MQPTRHPTNGIRGTSRLRLALALAILPLATTTLAGAQTPERWPMVTMQASLPTTGDAPVATKYIEALPARLATFPPSCLDMPLPAPTAGEPQSVGTLRMTNRHEVAVEDWEVRVYRRPCTAGRSVVLVKFTDLTPASDLDAAYPPIFVMQNGVRTAALFSIDPRARVNYLYPYTDVVPDGTLVLQGGADYMFDQNAAFRIELVTDAGNALVGDVPAYNAAAYPEAGQALLINGYVAGSYFDLAHSGEGILLEVDDSGNDIVVFLAWFTYDSNGRPYWIAGNTTVARNSRMAAVPMLFYSGGGFAGNFNASSVQSSVWGMVSISFPDCENMQLQYQSSHATAGVPSGSGTRSWTHLVGINGLDCR